MRKSHPPRCAPRPTPAPRLAPFACLAALSAPLLGPAVHAGPPAHAGLFATDPGPAAPGPAGDPGPDGAAAIVNGQVIPRRAVLAACLRRDRARVIDRLVQDYVVDRECARRGLTVPEAAIDARVADLRRALAPQTLEQTAAAHGATLADVRADFRRQLARVRLVADQIAPPPMAHCVAVVIPFRPDGAPARLAGGVTRTAPDARRAAARLRARWRPGEELAALAGGGEGLRDLGVLYPGAPGVDPAVTAAAATLPRGGVPPAPVRTADALVLLQAVSTGTAHPSAEEAAYAAARDAFREQQAQFLGPPYVVSLIDRSHITFAPEEALDPPPGVPLPAAAAVVDGHPIPAAAVVAACLAADGPQVTDILVQDAVVDQECARRGVRIADAEIDRRVDALARSLAPHTLAEGLAAHRTTLAALRADFRQQLERARLVEDRVTPPPMTRCEVLSVPFGPARPAADAAAAARALQRRLAAGVPFANLAPPAAAPAGPFLTPPAVFYPGMHGVDTAVLQAGLALAGGAAAPAPVRTPDAFCLVHALSTRARHPAADDAAYADAWRVYREQEAEPLIPAAVVALLRKSRVRYFIHA